MSDADIVREALRWHEYGSQDERRKEALAALARMEEKVKQSLYYSECRDKWREQAESVVAARDRLKDQLAVSRIRARRLEDERDESVANGLRLAEENERLQQQLGGRWVDKMNELEAEVERLRTEVENIELRILDDDIAGALVHVRAALHEGSASEVRG